MAHLDLVGSFSNLWTDIECPNCKIENALRLKEVIIESSIICRGCYADVHFVQVNASGYKSKQAAQKLQDSLNELSRDLKIRLG